MKKWITLLLAGLIFSIAGISGTLAADETKMPSMDAAAMQEMMKLGSPGENHKFLEPMVGEWTHVVRWWMQPDMDRIGELTVKDERFKEERGKRMYDYCKQNGYDMDGK